MAVMASFIALLCLFSASAEPRETCSSIGDDNSLLQSNAKVSRAEKVIDILESKAKAPHVEKAIDILESKDEVAQVEKAIDILESKAKASHVWKAIERAPPTPIPAPTPAWLSAKSSNFSEYCQTVYGEIANQSRALEIISSKQFLYSKPCVVSNPVEQLIRSDCWIFTSIGDRPCGTHQGFHPGWGADEGVLVYNPVYQQTQHHWNNSDYSFVEVVRWGSHCSLNGCDGLRAWNQGVDVPYGCWFYITSGSGIYVNVLKSLRLRSRAEAAKVLTPWHPEALDKYWCSEAIKRGYDSVQIGVDGSYYMNHSSKRERDQTELIICTGGCETQKVCDTCPPVPMRTGAHAELECECNNSIGLLNCGKLCLNATCHGPW